MPAVTPNRLPIKTLAENITMVLYPNDSSENGKELRLRQQYFLASASVQDKLDKWISTHGENFDTFAEKNCFQLNDTHPTIAIPELMRLFMDEYGMGWEKSLEYHQPNHGIHQPYSAS